MVQKAAQHEDHGHAAQDHAGAIPHPAQEVHDGRHDVDHVELRQEARGLAGDPEIEIVIAQHVEREENHEPARNTSQVRPVLAAREPVGGDGESDGHHHRHPDGPGGAVLGNVLHVFRGDLEVGGHQPESREPVGEDGNGDGREAECVSPGG